MSDADIDGLLKLEVEGHEIPWTKGIFQDCIRVGYYCILLEIRQVCVVYAVMSMAAGEAHILNVCVNRANRHQGFGRKAILHMLEVAKKNNINTIFLEVRPSNVIAIALYESLGFVEVGQRKNYYPKGDGGREDALLMAREMCFDFS